jgi:hypothetical protein
MKRHVKFLAGVLAAIVVTFTIAATFQSDSTPPFEVGSSYEFGMATDTDSHKSGDVTGIAGKWVKLRSQIPGENGFFHVWINTDHVRTITPLREIERDDKR